MGNFHIKPLAVISKHTLIILLWHCCGVKMARIKETFRSLCKIRFIIVPPFVGIAGVILELCKAYENNSVQLQSLTLLPP